MERLRGQVFENVGGDLPGAPCACAECSEAPSAALACAAHGVPLAFDAALPLWLPVFPPRFVDVVDDAGRDERLPVAQPGIGHAPWAAAGAPGTIDLEWLQRLMRGARVRSGDTIRVGVYPKDEALRAGGTPAMEVATRDVPEGGPQVRHTP
jgi:hypothetical protein